MKTLIRCFWLLLCFGFVSSVWAQNQDGMMRPGRHLTPRHRMASLMSKSKMTAQSGTYLAFTIACDKSKTWDLGVYPKGGTWAQLNGINDFGVAMGWGDVPIEGGTETRMIGICLFGLKAGQWFDSGLSSEEVWAGEAGGISNTGIIVGNILGPNGNPEAYAWMPSHGGFHLGPLPGDDASGAWAINRSGTFIVGASRRMIPNPADYPNGPNGPHAWLTPVVWTPKVVWNNGRPTVKWEIHALPIDDLGTKGKLFTDITLNLWGGYGVNDFGQIAGDGYTYIGDNWYEIAVVWNPANHSRGWEVQQLPMADGFAYNEALAINNRGEIVGDVWESLAAPALWKKDSEDGNTWKLTVLPDLNQTPMWDVATGINELGDIVGYCQDADWVQQATRWNTHDLSFVTSLGFPGDTSWAGFGGVNNLGIAVGVYQKIVSYDDDGNPIYSDPQAVAVRFR